MQHPQFILLVTVLLAGCMPLKQYNVTGGGQYDHLGYLEREHAGLLQIGPSNVPKAVQVIDAESYAIGPGESRYAIETEPHPYDLREDKDTRVPYVRDRVYLVQADGRRLDRAWRNGRWRFHFVLNGPDGIETRDFTMEMGTFYYNPAIHGPPN